ncbi:hypothetical protein OsI_20250 [Oryza sativa Indica Group]|uniref:Uncharacterized protein n=1 Tax=Oryza sativa subsp. indica TaxID=39946 RepID=A2Y5I1_ORYSI|nr:hypothetical protein OsI_20250 [Oryza sativa Indica Group]
MGKKGKWFDAVQRALSTSENDRHENEKKGKRSTLKKILQFSKSSASTSSPPVTSPSARQQPHHHHPPPPQAAPPDRQRDDGIKEAKSSDAAAAAAQKTATATAVTRPTTTAPRAPARSAEELAAVKIQKACRVYLGRRSQRVRGLDRLMLLLEGLAVKRQTYEALYCMQTMTRVQTQIHSRRVKTEEDKKALKSQVHVKQSLDRIKIGESWDHGHQSKEQIETVLTMKQEAALRRQRALAYAFSHQETFICASLAASNVHGHRQPQLGMELGGAMDGGGEAVGEPDHAGEQRPCSRGGERRRQREAGAHVGADTHVDAGVGQVHPPAELPVAVDTHAAVAVEDVGGAAVEPGRQPVPEVGDGDDRPAPHDEPAAGAAAELRAARGGERQPGPRREGRRRPPLAAAHDEPAVRGAAEEAEPRRRRRRPGERRRGAADAELHADDQVREGQGGSAGGDRGPRHRREDGARSPSGDLTVGDQQAPFPGLRGQAEQRPVAEQGEGREVDAATLAASEPKVLISQQPNVNPVAAMLRSGWLVA